MKTQKHCARKAPPKEHLALGHLYKIKKQQNVIRNSYEKPLFYDIREF
ncbi:hypothetical protein LEP1GSC125_2068 [Leptospira mayottensis 200901122]|uniref:Uncharacterized protein n=1 Tax=Leptospira mayottensis 200901122 TaxID=1193010 RepID=A0AA87MRF4_9LEPT|nr:hypothetical protein LEP1GSC125_2068 [Leptospira mayottensis 200901122]